MKYLTRHSFTALLAVAFVFACASKSTNAQVFDWAAQFGSTGDDFGTSTVADNAGNTYTCGFFNTEADLDPGAGNFLINTPSTSVDMFIVKLDPLGNFVWGRHFTSIGRNRAEAIAIDRNDNIYVTGYFEGTVDFEPGAGTTNLTAINDRDVFILKLDTNGDFEWVKHFGGNGFSQGLDITVGREGHVYTTGLFSANYVYEPTAENIAINTAGGQDGYVFELDPAGVLVEFVQTASPSNVISYGVDVDVDGNIYTTGFFAGTLDFGNGDVLTATGARDVYVAKYPNSAGSADWAIGGIGAGSDRARALRVDRNGNVYFSGWYGANINFTDVNGTVSPLANSGGNDIYVGSLNSLGETRWIHGIGAGGTDESYGIEVDNIGNVYMSGLFSNTVDFDPGVGVANQSATAAFDPFILKLDSSGTYINSLTYGGERAYSLFVANDWDIYAVGYFVGTNVDFDPGVGTFNLTSDDLNAPYVSRFEANCTAPDAPTLSTVSTDVCPNTSVTIDITAGNLNDATDWVWYSDPLFTDSIFSGISYTTPILTDTVSYYVRGEGACVVNTSEITINVGDNTPPVITLAASVTLPAASGACYYASENLTVPVVTDDCGVDTLFNDADLLMLTGLDVVTWTAIDINGNVSTASQDVIIEDQEAPTIAAPADITISADASCQASGISLGTPAANDNCTISNIINNGLVSYPVGTTVVTWTVTDGSGNSTVDQQLVTVIDDTDPLIIGLPTDITLNNDAGDCSAIVSWTEPTFTDNCSAGIIQTSGIPNGDPFPVGTTTIEYTATDGSGNAVVGTFDVIVIDNEVPTITPPADVTVSADYNCTASGVTLGAPTTGDNCGIASTTNNASLIYPLGATTVTWTVTDNSGNVTTATQDVIVEDTDAPTITAPADITLVADGSCQATVTSLGTPSTDDNCSVALVTNNDLGTYSLGSTTVTWVVTDGSGNTSTDTQIVTVVDETDPVIVDLPADIVVSNDGGVCNAFISWTEPTFTDNCIGANISQTGGISNNSSFPVGTTVVEYSALDGSGNEVVATFNVTVNDNENPTIIAAADTTIAANNFCTALNVVLDAPTVNDNCGILTVTNDAPVLYELDSTTVTWTVTDINGNTATATQFVIIADSTAPQITAPLPVTAYVDTLCQTTIDTLGTPITSDNCSVDTIYNDAPATYTTGDYLITWYAEDVAGNIDSTTQVVTILDTIRPEPILVDTTLILDPAGPISLFGSDIDAGSTDNCGLDQVILEQNTYDCEDLGTNIIEVRVIDVNGNVYDTSIVVTVEESGIDLDFDQIDDACDDNINTTTVVVPSGFTPNGDGINDLLVITALSNYTTVKLTIFNRYGNEVYQNDQYQNDWNGTNSKNGMELPDGTYFYVLELDGGENLNGYIHINRTL
jgi:gliding motility-associated-like protein